MESQIAFLNKYGRAYVTYCKSICREYDINQTEFDILMFFGNNPEYDCAKDIVDVRKIKANLVSINVDKLVNDGYLERKLMLNDRRKYRLVLTKQGKALVKKGKEVQDSFFELLFNSVSAKDRSAFNKVLELIDNNLERILKD
ncbi:MAG: MarR family transcriptional regulator [Solobacterium sp.]|nr:MarR family transcriptional regulator [Solobacterium sp.]MDY3794634.1 MarR family transcriptional regulator [Erysipelotrichaceae bacterium]MCI6696178.1 MarR family transcriptional regulator [Solobacterium sp.]MCI6846161.1 MarR family transcriptional regulator [Solobacterium sp.]MCI6878073.1 MarR family transcriptional regulator [Solobacterium sp.]